MNTCCTVVIGHVDHGKTSLVHALTGMETDRLAEEKARGLSIKPGFAYRSYPGGTIDFIDAPGHEDFIQAMISGASGARAALVVISATEGIGAQTLEHISIAGLLGLTHGVIAVTKSDLLDPSDKSAQLSEIRATLSQTALANAPLVLCSARTTEGMDQLHEALQALIPQATAATDPQHSFLPIDRVFTLPGRGTIVTGTLLGQDLAADAQVVLEPGEQNVTIRGLQSRGVERDQIMPGERMAANLRGVAVGDIPRGAVLCTKGAGVPSRCIDVKLETLATTKRALKHMDEVRVLFGTSSEVASLRLFRGGRLEPGQSGLAQLRFNRPVVGYVGQRAIVRHLSPPETIGGAVFLDPEATPVRSGDKDRMTVLEAVQTRDALQIAQALSTANGGVASLRNVARLSRTSLQETHIALGTEFENIDADLIAPTNDISTCKSDALTVLAAYHAQHPLRAMVPQTVIAVPNLSSALMLHVQSALVASGQVRQKGTRIAFADHDPLTLLSNDQKQRLFEIDTTFREAGLTPPPLEELLLDGDDNALLDLLSETDHLVALHNVSLKQTLILHSETLKMATRLLCTAFPPPQSFTTGEARAALDTSRRIIVPLLEHFDTCGVTLRAGNTRQMTGANPVSPPRLSC